MYQLQRIPTLVRSGIVSCLIIGLVGVRDALSAHTGSLNDYLLYGSWAVLTLGLYSVERATLWLLDQIRLLRRWIMGRDDIEGDWVDTARDADGQLRYISMQTIGYRDGTLQLYGIDWTPDGHVAQLFNTDACVYRDSRLRFMYEQKGGLVRGLGEIKFASDEGRPTRYSGWVLDMDHQWRPLLSGVRIDYGLLKRRPTDVAAKWAVAKQAFETHLRAQTDARAEAEGPICVVAAIP